ncbi:MAG: hypothetical protein ACRBBP_03355 [Bdellovibrionales bacterium]
MLKKVVCTLAAVGFLTSSVSSFGVSRASLFLVGQVDVIVNLFVNPVLGGIDTLDIENGETARLVATVDEETNNSAGYRIDMESVNAGTLEHNNGVANVAYTIAYDGAVAVAVPAVGAPTAVKTVAGPLTGLTTDNSDVEITVTAGGAALPAGAYTDTLIFTMVAL